MNTFMDMPTIAGGVTMRHGVGPGPAGGGTANGHGDIGTDMSVATRAGAPLTITVVPTVGVSLNIPPCEHWIIALALSASGTRPSLPSPAGLVNRAERDRAAGVVVAGGRGQVGDQLRHLVLAGRGAGQDGDRPDAEARPLDAERAREVLEPGEGGGAVGVARSRR